MTGNGKEIQSKIWSTSLSWIKVFVVNLKQPKPKLANKTPLDEGDF